MRFVLYGGKGGVGKTTCAAATGLKLADRGERTLVVSTDPAHSLGDTLGVALDGDPTEIEADLWGVEADPERGQAAYRAVVTALAAQFREAGIRLTDEDIERLFAAGFVPGSDEVASLELFLEYSGDDRWDRLVFDTAPTGHTLRLLTLPDVLSESLSTAATIQREVRTLVDSARSMVFGPAAFWGSDGDDKVAVFRDRMEEVATLLTDPDQTAFRVVLLPERLAIEETGRLLERLESFEVPVETLIVNRVRESDPEDCDRCAELRTHHSQQVETIRETFPDLDVQVLPELGPELYGREALEQLAGRIEI